MSRLLPRLVLLLFLGSIPLAALNGLSTTSLTISLAPVVADGLASPVYLTHAGDGSGRLFIVELEGRVRVLRQGHLLLAPYLDIGSKVACCSEQGLFSIAFDPEFETNGEFYVDYTDRNGDTVVERYTVPDPSADTAGSVTVTTVLKVDQPYFNHNGGQLQFGPDGYLYVSLGDGGGKYDPQNRARSLESLLGKMLRIEVRGASTYAIPTSNPHVRTANALPEIWASGLRNPWRFSFDRATGDLYIGDVGQSCYERVLYQPAGSPGGQDYGWPAMEGLHAFDRTEAGNCDQPRVSPANITLPIAEYSHRWGRAVTGGYVYRGRVYPWLDGLYIFGDFVSGRIWSLRRVGPEAWRRVELLNAPFAISSFGEDEEGEHYVLDFAGGVCRITSEPPADTPWASGR